MRFSIRLGNKDRDIILLTHCYQASDLLRRAISFYLGDRQSAIPLSPLETVPNSATVYFVLERDADAGYREFLESVPPGNRATVVKLLIRHAMEQCDIRPYMDSERNAQDASPGLHAKKKPRREAKAYEPPVSAQSQQNAGNYQSVPASDDSDDIFSMI